MADDNFNSTPYSTIFTHLHYLQANEYDPRTASKAFDIDNPQEAEKMAIELRQILDGKGIFIKLDNVPDDPNYIDSTKRKAVYILNNRLPQVYLEKRGEKWYYSRETVDAIPTLYKLVYPFGATVWVKLFPYKSGQTILKLHYWQWIGIACILSVFLAVYFLGKFIAFLLARRIVERRVLKPFEDVQLLRRIANSFSLIIAFFIVRLFLPTLLLSNKLSASLTKAVDLVSGIVLIIFLFQMVGLLARIAELFAKQAPSTLDNQLIPVLKRFSKLFVLLFGVFYILRILDVNLTTVIAGISIGGLAFALAAQDTVKNFIGSLMIFADRPFKIGDTISGSNFEGIVLEVGFRSTRIKTPNDSIVTVANGKLADMTIDNKGFRVFKKFKTELAVSLVTPLPRVEQFLEGIRNILQKYPYVQNSSIDVFLSNIQSPGMLISVNFKYKVYDQREEFKHREFILLHILQLAELMQVRLFDQPLLPADGPKMESPQALSEEQVRQRLQQFFSSYEAKVAERI